MNRHNFSESVKNEIKLKTGFICNNPACRKLLWNLTPNRFSGKIAHIVAASPNGPRAIADNHLNSKDLISNFSNGIALCSPCELMVDSDTNTYTVEVLSRWKLDAEELFSQYQKENFPAEFTADCRTIFCDNPNTTKQFQTRIKSLDKIVLLLQTKLSTETEKCRKLHQIALDFDTKNQQLLTIIEHERHDFMVLKKENQLLKQENVTIKQQLMALQKTLYNRLSTRVFSLFSIFSSDESHSEPLDESSQKSSDVADLGLNSTDLGQTFPLLSDDLKP